MRKKQKRMLYMIYLMFKKGKDFNDKIKMELLISLMGR